MKTFFFWLHRERVTGEEGLGREDMDREMKEERANGDLCQGLYEIIRYTEKQV